MQEPGSCNNNDQLVKVKVPWDLDWEYDIGPTHEAGNFEAYIESGVFLLAKQW